MEGVVAALLGLLCGLDGAAQLVRQRAVQCDAVSRRLVEGTRRVNGRLDAIIVCRIMHEAVSALHLGGLQSRLDLGLFDDDLQHMAVCAEHAAQQVFRYRDYNLMN